MSKVEFAVVFCGMKKDFVIVAPNTGLGSVENEETVRFIIAERDWWRLRFLLIYDIFSLSIIFIALFHEF